jgi:hypothetical protein
MFYLLKLINYLHDWSRLAWTVSQEAFNGLGRAGTGRVLPTPMEFPNSVDGYTMWMIGRMAKSTPAMAMFFAGSSWHQRNQIHINSALNL